LPGSTEVVPPCAAFGGWLGSINANLTDPKKVSAADDFLSYMNQKAQSFTDVTIGWTGVNPYRISQTNSIEPWVAAGFNAESATKDLDAVYTSLHSPNLASDLRIPGSAQYLGRFWVPNRPASRQARSLPKQRRQTWKPAGKRSPRTMAVMPSAIRSRLRMSMAPRGSRSSARLPCHRLPPLRISDAFRVIEAFKIIDLPNTMTAGGPGSATDSSTLHAFYKLRSLDFSESAAIVYLLLLVAEVACLSFFSLKVHRTRKKAADAFLGPWSLVILSDLIVDRHLAETADPRHLRAGLSAVRGFHAKPARLSAAASDFQRPVDRRSEGMTMKGHFTR
jgi:hypothetical protein